MNNNRRIMGIIIVVIGLILFIAVIYFMFFNSKTKPSVVSKPIVNKKVVIQEQVSTSTPGDKPRNYKKYDISSEPVHKYTSSDAGKMAMAFSERLGSYSNQSNYGNFTDLKIFMTDEMKSWADKYVQNLKNNSKTSASYYGIISKALTNEVIKFDDKKGIAEILVTTKRKENYNDVNKNKSYIQKIKIYLVREDGGWLVDKAYWQ